MENYLHAQVINEHFQINVAIEDMTDVPTLVAETVSQVQGHPLGSLGAGRAKKILNNEVVSKMTPELLEQVDIDREIAGWLNVINQRIN
jgi:hypothetical protein